VHANYQHKCIIYFLRTCLLLRNAACCAVLYNTANIGYLHTHYNSKSSIVRRNTTHLLIRWVIVYPFK